MTVLFGAVRRLRSRLGKRWYAFQRDHQARAPEGWATGPPDFVGVGVQKAGTTWWYHLIARHPRVVHRRRPKELHYFDKFRERSFGNGDVEYYHRYFARPPGAVVGEWTPGYMFFLWPLDLLEQSAPDASILVMLRDPVERYRSGITMHSQAGRNRNRDAMHAFARGLYSDQLARLFRHFARERVLIQQYERAHAEPTAELARTYRFLGLDDGFVPDDLLSPQNATRTDKLLLDEAMRRRLVEAYEPDVERVGALVPEIDVGAWPNFAHLA